MLAHCSPTKHGHVLNLLGEALAAREVAGEPTPKPLKPKTGKTTKTKTALAPAAEPTEPAAETSAEGAPEP